MSDSLLLKYARVRDDQEFKWRIAAAMQLKAQEAAGETLPDDQRQLVDWVLDNPMVPLERMVAAVAVNKNIAAYVTLTDDVVDTTGIPDSDIVYVVTEVEWARVARNLYADPRSAQPAAASNGNGKS